MFSTSSSTSVFSVKSVVQTDFCRINSRTKLASLSPANLFDTPDLRPKIPPAPQVDRELWRELYRAALEFQVLAPWNWVSSDDGLGIDNEHGVRLLSILGGNREMFFITR
jgi:hypothetical protein